MATQRYKAHDAKRLPTPAYSAVQDVVDNSILGIRSGDLVEWNRSGNYIRPANMTWDTDKATSQIAFAKNFVGVCYEAQLRDAPAGYLAVLTEGVFEIDCASATYEVGDRVGLAKQSGNGLERATVEKVESDEKSIGVVVEYKTSATTILVQIQPKVLLDQTDAVGSVSVTTGAEDGDEIDFTIQLKDRNGNDLKAQKVVHFWLAEDADPDGVPAGTAPDMGLTVGTGTQLGIFTADAELLVLTDVNGTAVITAEESAANQFVPHAVCEGQHGQGDETVFTM